MAKYADTGKRIEMHKGTGYAKASDYNIQVFNIQQQDIPWDKVLWTKQNRPNFLAGLILQDLIAWSSAHFIKDPDSNKLVWYRYSEEPYVWKKYSSYLDIGNGYWSNQQVKRAYQFLRDIGFLVTRLRLANFGLKRYGLAMILQPKNIQDFITKNIKKISGKVSIASDGRAKKEQSRIPGKVSVETTNNINYILKENLIPCSARNATRPCQRIASSWTDLKKNSEQDGRPTLLKKPKPKILLKKPKPKILLKKPKPKILLKKPNFSPGAKKPENDTLLKKPNFSPGAKKPENDTLLKKPNFSPGAENPGIGSSPNSGREKFRNMKPPDKKFSRNKIQKDKDSANQILTSRKVGRMINYWNEQTVPQWKKLNRTHGGNETKVYKSTVGYLKNFLSGKLMNIAIIPDYVNTENLGKFTEDDFYTFVDRYVKLCSDHGLRYYQRTPCVLKIFLFGNEFGTKYPSKFLSLCLKEPEPAFTQENPNWVHNGKELYRTYIDRNKTFDAREQKDLYQLCEKLINHFDGEFKNKNYTSFLDWFFQSMRAWNPGTTRGLLSDGCWKMFLEHHRKTGR